MDTILKISTVILIAMILILIVTTNIYYYFENKFFLAFFSMLDFYDTFAKNFKVDKNLC